MIGLELHCFKYSLNQCVPAAGRGRLEAAGIGGCFDAPVPETSYVVKNIGFFSKGKRPL